MRIIVDARGQQAVRPTPSRCSRGSPMPARRSSSTTPFPSTRTASTRTNASSTGLQDDVGHADHRKLYVIDGTVAWIGGAGIEDHFENGKFHDVMARVTGNVVRQAQALFLMSFRAHGGPLPADLSKYFPEQPEAGTIPIALLQVVPGGFMSATQAIRELIDHAKTRLDIMNPYFTDADMIQRVIAAAKRGVKVRIVVSQTSNNAAGDGGAEVPLREPARRGRPDLGVPGRRRPREARRRGRHRRLRHRQPRCVGSLPELRGRDDGRERGHGEPVRGARLHAGHRALASRARRPAACRHGSRTGSGTSWRTSSDAAATPAIEAQRRRERPDSRWSATCPSRSCRRGRRCRRRDPGPRCRASRPRPEHRDDAEPASRARASRRRRARSARR